MNTFSVGDDVNGVSSSVMANWIPAPNAALGNGFPPFSWKWGTLSGAAAAVSGAQVRRGQVIPLEVYPVDILPHSHIDGC